ncbi:head-closure protein [Vibrio phage 1.232.O._10N.261.51.E11]|nr:head-closure protein [Vibrio phage 1.232.O._10N.261.51.E11]
MTKLHDSFPFFGGLDVNTPYLQRNPGSLINSLNYEPDPDGGYRRIRGYERYDGQPSPTDSGVTAIPVSAVITPAPTLGDVLTGSDSGATGNYLDQDADLLLVYVTNINGTYTSVDTVSGATVTGDSTNAIQLIDNADFVALRRSAREYNRTQIQEVPGTGPVHAVYEHDNVVYAIRNAADGLSANIYKDSGAGWQLVDLSNNFIVSFDNGTGGSDDPFAIGNVVTGATSGATGTVTAVGVQSSDRQGGYISLKSVTGTFQDDENLNVGSTMVATVNGAPQAVSLNPNGKYRIVSYNFFGGLDTFSMYITNGVQTALQFDGESVAPIFTGLDIADDTPNDVIVHYDHLFLAFDNGLLQHSVIGEPLNWRGEFGAFQFALGSNITNLIVSPRALVVTTSDNVQVIYGQGTDNWEKAFITEKGIGVIGSGQYLSVPLVLDRAGVLALDRVEAFGNFQDSIISENVRSIVNRLYTNVTGSMVDKLNNHYILFSSTGENLLTGFSRGSFIGYFPINFGRVVLFASSHEDRMFFTDTVGGYVYLMRKGTSFDGGDIESIFQSSYAFQGEPQRKKRYRRVTISLKSFLPTLALSFAFSFGKGDAQIRSSTFNSNTLGGGGRWDVDNWDEFFWDGQDVPEIISDIDGVGTDISTLLYSNSAEIDSYVIEDITIQYSPRSLKR